MLSETERIVQMALDQEAAREADQHLILTAVGVFDDYQTAYEALTPHNRLLFKRYLVRTGQAVWAYPELAH